MESALEGEGELMMLMITLEDEGFGVAIVYCKRLENHSVYRRGMNISIQKCVSRVTGTLVDSIMKLFNTPAVTKSQVSKVSTKKAPPYSPILRQMKPPSTSSN